MEKETILIDFSPGRLSLENIEKWLEEERRITGKGFYVNWTTIKNAFARDQMVVLEVDGKPLGFAVWRINGKLAYLDIFEIHPDYRKKGLGRRLLDGIVNHFLSIGVLIVELQCEPPESELTWRKLGFNEFDPSFSSWGHKRLYKILIAPFMPGNTDSSDELMSLWDKEAIYVRDKPPVWQWNLTFKEETRQLIRPIIISCNKDWKLSLLKNGREVIAKKAKYFQEDCMSGDFLVIETVP